MDDERAQFLIIVGEVCQDARLAGLAVEVITDDGRHVAGIPLPRDATGAAEADHTGWAQDLLVGEQRVDLESITEIRVRGPVARDR